MIRSMHRILAVLTVVAFGSTVRAADLVHTFEHGPAGTLWNVATAPDLPQFDQATYGTLDSITLLLEYSFSGTGTFTNQSGVSNTYTLDVEGKIGLTPTNIGGSGFGTPWVQSGNDYILLDSETFTDLAPNTPTPFSYSTSVLTSSVTLTGGDMATFIGTGSLPTYLKANTLFTITGAGETTITTNPLASGKITMTYSFTPVPEPSTYAMAGLSTLAIAGVSLRRSRKKSA